MSWSPQTCRHTESSCVELQSGLPVLNEVPRICVSLGEYWDGRLPTKQAKAVLELRVFSLLVFKYVSGCDIISAVQTQRRIL